MKDSCYLLISAVFITSDFHKTFPCRGAVSVAAIKAVRNTASVQGSSENSFLFPSEKLWLWITICMLLWENRNVTSVFLSVSATLLLPQWYSCYEEGRDHFPWERGGTEVTRDDCRTRTRRNGHMDCKTEPLHYTEVKLSLCIDASLLSRGTMASKFICCIYLLQT